MIQVVHVVSLLDLSCCIYIPCRLVCKISCFFSNNFGTYNPLVTGRSPLLLLQGKVYAVRQTAPFGNLNLHQIRVC